MQWCAYMMRTSARNLYVPLCRLSVPIPAKEIEARARCLRHGSHDEKVVDHSSLKPATPHPRCTYHRRDSDPHWARFKLAVSAVGLRWRVTGGTCTRTDRYLKAVPLHWATVTSVPSAGLEPALTGSGPVASAVGLRWQSCRRGELHSHWTGSRPAVSAVGLRRRSSLPAW